MARWSKRIAAREYFIVSSAPKQIAGNLDACERGEIDYPEFMRRDISLWKPIPHISPVELILKGFKLKPNAAEVVAEIHRRVTGSRNHGRA